MKALKARAKKDALKLAITAAEGDAALVDKYTEESIEKLQKAIKEAKEVLADENASQEEVDAAEKVVKAAQKALVEKETPKPEAPVKKDELKAAVEDATKVVGDTEQYTEESLAALQAAIDDANAVLDNPEATQAEIDAAVKAVKEAKDLTQGGEEYLACSAKVISAIEFIRNNYARQICLEDIAEYAGVSRVYLSQIFKKETGKNISDYLVEYRLGKAKELLLNSNLKIYTIAELCGFGSAQYFNKIFKKMNGISPYQLKDNKLQ